MSLKSILFAGATAFTLLAGAVPANASPYYSCNDGRCYDDQAEETRELNLRQLYNPGAGVHAVPGHDDDRYGDDDRGDDRYGDRDDEDQAQMDHGRHHAHHGYGYRDGGSSGNGSYGPRDDRDDDYGPPNDDDDQYGDDDQSDDGAYDDDNDDRDDDR